MKAIRVMIAGLALLTLLALPAAAQEQEDVTKTFRLTLYGDAPEGEQFDVSFFQGNSGDASGFPFCGTEGGTGTSAEPCEGGGTVYTAAVEVPAGTEIRYTFRRYIPGTAGEVETFATGTETITADMTNSAYYDFSTGQGSAGDGPQEMPDVPATGAGGAVAANLPLGSIAAAGSLLVAGGYAARRRR